MAETQTFRMWKKLATTPVVGKRLFSLTAALTAPYLRVTCPRLETIGPGLAVARMPAWWDVRNHTRSVHAATARSLTGFAMDVLCETSAPATHHWVPKDMTMSYKRISIDGLTAVAKAKLPDFSTITPETGGVDFPVHIVLTDAGGTEV